MRLVSKSWRDMLVRSDFPVKPEPPWLFLPIDSYDQPGYYSNQISFESLSEDRIYNFHLRYDPFCSSGGQYHWCCCGSSSDGGSWLLMAGSNADHDLSATAMMLWHPISGTTKRLPALSTLPFFSELLETCTREVLDIYCSPAVIARAQVFSVGSVECVVAVVFSGILNPNLNRLALCSPREESWKVVPYGAGEYYKDILFHNGHLFLRIRERWNVVEHLVGSSAGGELLVVSTVLEEHSHNGGGEEPSIKPYTYSFTRGFEVYGLDVNANNDDDKRLCCLERLKHVGKQSIFVGATGSTSFIEAASGGDGGNIIHFATNDADGVNWAFEQDYDYEEFVFHERGVFDVARDTIEWTYWKKIHVHTKSCVGWFTPKLW